MVNLKCPYSEIEILTSTLSMTSKVEAFLTEKSEDYFQEEIGRIVSDLKNKDTTENMAKHYGVSALDLINSPNYTKLAEEYREALGTNLIAKLESSFGFSKKEGWAFLVHCLK